MSLTTLKTLDLKEIRSRPSQLKILLESISNPENATSSRIGFAPSAYSWLCKYTRMYCIRVFRIYGISLDELHSR